MVSGGQNDKGNQFFGLFIKTHATPPGVGHETPLSCLFGQFHVCPSFDEKLNKCIPFVILAYWTPAGGGTKLRHSVFLDSCLSAEILLLSPSADPAPVI